MANQDFIPIGEDWFISVSLTDESTGLSITSLTLTATLKTEAGVTVTVAGQGDAMATVSYDATSARYEGTIPGTRLTGLTGPTSAGVETWYVLWLTEAAGKVNRKIRLPARYHGKSP